MKNRFNVILILLLLGITLAAPAFAQTDDDSIRKAQIFIYDGSYDKAAKILQDFLKREPGNADAHYLLGLCYRGLKDYDKAEAEFEASIKIIDDFEEAYLQKASVLAEKKDFAGAEKTLDSLLIKNPKSSLAHYAKGVIYYMQQKVPDAIKEFDAALVGNPNFTVAYANLGYIYYNQGNFDMAAENLKKASSLDEKNPEYFFALGWLERKRGNKTAADKYFSIASSLGAPTVYSATIKSIAAYDKEDLKGALEALEEVFAISPEFEKGLLIQAQIYTKLYKYGEAEQILNSLLKSDPLDADAKEEMEKLKPLLLKADSPPENKSSENPPADSMEK